jgi:putative DNA primase/helicase
MTAPPDNIVKLAKLQEDGALPPNAEIAIALQFAERYANELRFVEGWGRWMRYDGSHWHRDRTRNAFDLVRCVCQEIAPDCGRAASAVASAKTVAGVERLAKANDRLAATTEQWDSGGYTFHATEEDDLDLAVTLDLHSGIGRPPSPLDYITKHTSCGCAPRGTPHPLWSKFLDRITAGNKELQSFLQRYIGYCCTGCTHEHVFVFAYGTGANGKSTFINIIARIFDTYATVADMSTFLASQTEQHRTDLAKLVGARLVVAQEIPKGRTWNESKIKNLTGGDPITARFMRQDFFDFSPKFKLFIVGNHKPRLGSVDEAIRRRMLLLPFAVQIPKDERDPQLPEKLWTERHAILRWCIDGCLEWQRIGLKPPKIVTDASEEYFDEQDTVKEWLEDCTRDGGPHAFTRTGELFASWKTWCESHNLKPGSEQSFSSALRDKGFQKKRNNAGQMGFRNLVLK